MDENRMTEIVDRVATGLLGSEWDGLDMAQRRSIKENLLPVILATVDAVEATPTVEALRLKEAIVADIAEDNQMIGELSDWHGDLVAAWNRAFPGSEITDEDLEHLDADDR